MSKPIIYEAEASELATSTPVLVEVKIEWDRARIEEEIRKVFPEAPNTAVAIAYCESGLVKDIQSHHVRNGTREPSYGVFQIHAPSWHKRAVALGLEDYKTDPGDNIQMARYIYDAAGQSFNDWTCYTKGMYKAKL